MRLVAAALAAALAVPAAQGEGTLSFAGSLTDHAVLSKSGPVLWGEISGDSIPSSLSVFINGVAAPARVEITPTASGQARWKASLDPQPPTLTDDGVNVTVTTPSGLATTLTDILFGRVIACSGQSNMQFTVSTAFNSTAEIAASAAFPRIRVAELARFMSPAGPIEDVHALQVGWARAGPASVGGTPWSYLSAVAWFTGREVFLRQPSPEPVGILVFAWGGTIIETWMRPEALHQCGEAPSPPPAPSALSLPGPGAFSASKQDPNNFTSCLWNGMVYPLRNTTVDAFLWYQGEQNVAVGNASGATNYSRCFPTMVADWRHEFAAHSRTSDAAPFVYVELAGWCEDADGGDCGEPIDAAHLVAELRWAQAARHVAVPNAALPNVGRVEAYDLADPLTKVDPPPFGDIHPRDKQDVGARAARVLLGLSDSVAPVLDGCSAGPGGVEATFWSATSGLWLNKDALTHGFDVRGADGTWTNTTIHKVDAATVTVAAPAGATGLRYAWRSDPCCPPWAYPACPRMNCALYDRAPSPGVALDPRLPVVPFSVEIAGGKCVVP